MISFRKVALSAVVALSAFAAVIVAGCKDKCGSVTCSNGGTCSNNVCVCPTGYSGKDCGTSYATPYVGTYTCHNTGSSSTWQSIITTDATNAGYVVDITNFANGNRTVVATVDSLSNNTSHMLIVPTADSLLRGTGTFSNAVNTKGEITVTYSTGGGFYTFIMDKQ